MGDSVTFHLPTVGRSTPPPARGQGDVADQGRGVFITENTEATEEALILHVGFVVAGYPGNQRAFPEICVRGHHDA